MTTNFFLNKLNKSQDLSADKDNSESKNLFVDQLERTEKKEKPLPWTEGLGSESLYRIPGFALQGIGGAIAGEPGDIASVANAVGGLGTEVAGMGSSPYEKTPVGKILPTTESLLKGAALKPKNKVEKFVQDLTKDATKLFLPGKYIRWGLRGLKYAMGPVRSLAISTGANLLGKGVEGYTGSETKGDIAKQGMLFTTSFLSPQTASKVVGETYAAAAAALPASARVNSGAFLNKLDNISNGILKGRQYDQLAPMEKWVLDRIKDYKSLNQNGQIFMESLVAQKTSTNQRLEKEIYELGHRSERQWAKWKMGEVRKAVSDEFKTYGRTNPQWWQLQKEADIASGTMAQSNLVERMIQPLLRGKEGSIVAHLFGGSTAATVGAVSKPLAGAGVALYQAAKYMYRIANSPVLREHYGRVISYALTGNKEKLAKALEELDTVLKKDDKKRDKKQEED